MRPIRFVSSCVPLFLLLAGCFQPSSTDPCEGVSCGAGSCVPSNGQAQCICQTGYTAQGLTCVQTDACQNDPCRATGKTCTSANGVATCSCPSGMIDQGNGCVQPSVCTTTACTQPHKTVCTPVNGQAVCTCDTGYLVSGNDCIADPFQDCSRNHSGTAADDAFEPNECPVDATPLTLGVAQDHTLGPAGDVDWIKVSTDAGNILELVITNSTAQLYIDVYGADAVTPIGSSHSGLQNPVLRFRAPNADAIYIRVKGLSASATTAYNINVTDKGPDDYANVAADALSVTPGSGAPATFNGELQYDGDVDVIRVAALAGHSYRFSLNSSSTASGVQVELYNTDGTTLRKTLDESLTANLTTFAHPAQDGYYLLRAKPADPTILGAFAITIDDLGVDDHGDVVLDATAINPATTSSNGSFERATDTDVFTFSVTQNHIYRFTCQPASSTYYGCQMALRDQSGTVIQQTGTYSSTMTIGGVASANGTWNVSVNHYTTSLTGAYTYKLEDLGADDHGNTAATATTVQTGVATAGNIEVSGDHDFLAVNTTAGHIYSVTCTSPTASYLCYLTIRDPNGTTAASTSYGSTTTAGFRAANGGLYTIETWGYSGYTGNYTITVTDTGGDDHGDTATTATSVTVGDTTSGNIQYSGDHDFLSFTTTASHIYTVSCTTSTTYLCAFYVRDASGTSVGSTSYGSATSVTFEAATSGTYTVDVYAYYSSATGAYSITVTDNGTDDHGDTASTATTITAGSATANGKLELAYDKDVFAFTATANHIYRFTCSSTQYYACVVNVRDASGTLVTSGSYVASAGTRTVRFFASTAQTYSIEVSAYSSYTGTYTYQLVDDGADDHPNTATGATALTTTASVSGNIQYDYDKDVFAITPTATHIYKVSCSSAVSSYLCTMTVRDSSGTSVATGSSTTPATFEAASSSTYTVEVTSSYTGYYGAFTLTLQDLGADDHGDTPATATTITSSSTAANGSLEVAYDKDVFAFTATANHIYRFTCTSTQYYACQVVVRDAANTTVTSGSYVGSAGTRTVRFVASSAQTYSVEVSAYSSYSGAYTYQLFDDGADDHANTSVGATTITAGATALNGNIQYDYDKDVFAFTATQGKIYKFTCTTSATYVCNLVAKDVNGTTVASASYGTNASVTFKATLSATYTVDVGAYYTSYYGAYSVGLTEITDDFGDNYNAATTLTLGSTVNGNLEIAGDQDWFQVTLAAGTSYSVTTTGAQLYVAVYDSTGITQVGSPTYVSKSFIPSTTGTYYVKLYGYYSSTTGAYTVKVQ